MYADVEGLIFFFIDQHITLRRGTHRVAPDLIRQQRGGMFTHVPHKAGIIAPGKPGGNIFQDLRVPFTAAKVAEAQAILAAGKIILRHRHQLVIRRDAQSAKGVELTFRRPLVAVEQDLPLVPLLFEHRLALIDGVFTARLVNLTVAKTIFTVRGGDFPLRNAVDNFFQQTFLQAELRIHHPLAVGVLRVQVLQHVRSRALIVAQPVIVIDACIAMQGHGVRDPFGFRWHVVLLLLYRDTRAFRSHGGA